MVVLLLLLLDVEMLFNDQSVNHLVVDDCA